MKHINFNNKTFSLIDNSEKGTANSNTTFEFKQTNELVTADYYGGSIKYGKIISILTDHTQLKMLYQCVTLENELKAGKALAEITITKEGKIKLKLDWEWLGQTTEKGTSEYIEN